MEPWEAGGDNATTPTIGVPVAPPTTPTYAYVYINYAIAGINGAIALFAIFVLIMQTRNLIRAPKLLFIHIILFLVCRIVLGLIPSRVYQEIKYMAPLQVFLDILPEALYQLVFVILNAMWTQIYLRIRSVPKKTTSRVFWGFYWILFALLIIGGAVLCLVVHLTKATNNRADPFLARFATWEGMYYSTAAVLILAANVIFGFGFLKTLNALEPLLTHKLQDKIFKTRLLVIFTFIATVLKAIYNFALQTWLTSLYANNLLNSQGFAGLWFCYFFVCESLPVAIVLGVFFFRPPGRKTIKSRKYDGSDRALLTVGGDDTLPPNISSIRRYD